VPAILAHQGGWDEILMVAVPCALLAWLLHVARRRSLSAQAERDTDTTSGAGHHDPR